jgi:hypothetical protein
MDQDPKRPLNDDVDRFEQRDRNPIEDSGLGVQGEADPRGMPGRDDLDTDARRTAAGDGMEEDDSAMMSDMDEEDDEDEDSDDASISIGTRTGSGI